MRFLPFKVLLVLLLAAAPAFSCTCMNPLSGVSSPLELATWHASHSDEVFEGTVSSVELVWILSSARVGDVIPADFEEDLPRMRVTFQVLHTFKGGQRTQVQIETGYGGGDCGYRFEVGEQYLVYADLDDQSGELSTSICSGTATVDESRAAIAKLSGERPSGETAAPPAPRTGKLCVRLARNPLPSDSYQIFLYGTGGNSFIPDDEAELQNDGSFCASDLKPGKYLLLLLDDTDAVDSSVSIGFYPGVAHVSEAFPIEVKAGETTSGLQFNVPQPLTHSVSGSIRAKNASKLPEQVEVILLSAEPSEYRFPYLQRLEQDGSFRFPKVLPGKYWAIATTTGEGSSNWSTRKVSVDVDRNVTGLSLELIPK
jgi:hypothetical protein